MKNVYAPGAPVVARQLIACGRLKPCRAAVRTPAVRCRKTTNRLRAIETFKAQMDKEQAQSRKTTNRLRAIETTSRIQLPSRFESRRKTTNRLRAIETTDQVGKGPYDDGGSQDN